MSKGDTSELSVSPLLMRGLAEKEHMNDTKNIFIAWISTSTSLFAAIELKTVLAIVSAIVLPIIFFSIGKTVDVLVQIHFRKREAERIAGATVSTPCGGGGLNADKYQANSVPTCKE